MKILFVGDIYAKAGRNAMHKYLPLIKEKYEVDFTILNGENTTHGHGLNLKNYAEIKNAGVDFITLGNHFLDNDDISVVLRNKTDIIRPLNLNNFYEGDGSRVVEVNGVKIRITNIIGRVYMNAKKFSIADPFNSMIDLLDKANEKVHIVDIHAEATGEKKSFAKYFDGKLSAVIGTHTHVQTADNQVFEKGLAYISDVGYCGSYDSVLGVCNKDAIAFSKDQNFSSHKPGDGDELEFSAVYLDIDENDGRARFIKRIYITPDKQDIILLD